MADTKTTAAKAAGGKSSAKKQKTTIRKKKAKLGFTKGVAHIHASFNNTIYLNLTCYINPYTTINTSGYMYISIKIDMSCSITDITTYI